MLRAHRQAWAWQDEWVELTMDDIRRLERETQLILQKKLGRHVEEEKEEEEEEEEGGWTEGGGGSDEHLIKPHSSRPHSCTHFSLLPLPVLTSLPPCPQHTPSHEGGQREPHRSSAAVRTHLLPQACHASHVEPSGRTEEEGGARRGEGERVSCVRQRMLDALDEVRGRSRMEAQPSHERGGTGIGHGEHVLCPA